jgi:hypothetical protein
MHTHRIATITAIALSTALIAAPQSTPAPQQQTLPRTADGKPDLEGIWQASSSAAADLQDHAASLNMPAGRSVIAGNEIPYQPWAAKQKAENYQNRQTADPLSKCYLPGVPRIMYLDFPFQIFQTPKAIAMAFEWELDYRLIYTDGSPHPTDADSWMGDSRGHWDGDTLVVDVGNINDKTWFDMAGDFHSDALHVIERYRMTGRDSIQYQATIEDSKVFTKPWTINIALQRRTDRDRLFEYSCQSEVEEANGAFTREERTWYPGSGTAPPLAMAATPHAPAIPPRVVANLRRTNYDKPDLQGFYESKADGANQALERPGAPAGQALIIDPPNGKLPTQPWAVDEHASRNLSERGYDDPTAHCFPQGVPRSMYIPQGIELIQTSDYVVFLFERMSWRIIPLVDREKGGRAHLPDNVRLWEGDSLGHWEGDTLVVDTTNLNGKTWLGEGGEIVSYAEHVVERFTPASPDTINYQATVTDPVVYTRPWTMAFPMKREKFQLIEAACHEEDRDLPHMKAIKDAAAGKKK